MKKILFFITISLVFCACKNESVNALQALQNQSFIIAKLEFEGKTLTPSPLQDENSSISFDETQYNGFAGCNHFFGFFATKGDKISFLGNGGATKMMCPPEIMGFEDDLLANLYGEFSLESINESLVLGTSKIKIFLVPKTRTLP